MKKAFSFLVAVVFALAVQAQTAVSISVDPETVVLEKSGKTTLSIAYEANAALQPLAYQMDIILPEGFVPVGVPNNVRSAIALDNADDVYPTSSPDCNTPVHQLTGVWKADKRMLRVLCFSMSNTSFKRGAGKLLKIKLKADETNFVQNGEAIIRNVTFVMPDLQKSNAPEVKFLIQLREE